MWLLTTVLNSTALDKKTLGNNFQEWLWLFLLIIIPLVLAQYPTQFVFIDYSE